MKALVLKPVMWNTNHYTKPSGYPSKSGFAKDYGYGHEEWNNSPKRIWRKFRVFHTESTEKLLSPSSLTVRHTPSTAILAPTSRFSIISKSPSDAAISIISSSLIA